MPHMTLVQTACWAVVATTAACLPALRSHLFQSSLELFAVRCLLLQAEAQTCSQGICLCPACTAHRAECMCKLSHAR